jgi:hypothetical protein
MLASHHCTMSSYKPSKFTLLRPEVDSRLLSGSRARVTSCDQFVIRLLSVCCYYHYQSDRMSSRCYSTG